MCLQSFGGVKIHIHTHTSSCLWRVKMTNSYTYTSLTSRAQTHIHLLARLFLPLQGALPLHTQTSSYLLDIWLMMTDTHAHTHTYA